MELNLIASAATSFSQTTQYVMELDTTALFNSPVKTSQIAVSAGGTVEFNNVPLTLDNVVYYWRVSEDSATKYWNGFSLSISRLVIKGLNRRILSAY